MHDIQAIVEKVLPVFDSFKDEEHIEVELRLGKYNGSFYPKEARFAEYLSSRNPRVKAMGTRFVNDKTLLATTKYAEIAKELGISAVTLAVAYSKQFDFVASTIIGARNCSQLDDSFDAIDLKLSEDTMEKIKKVQLDIMYPMG